MKKKNPPVIYRQGDPPVIYRQGDVLIMRAPDETPLGKEIPRDRGRVVLAYGELTGHAHAISARGAALHERAQEDAAALMLAERILTVVGKPGVKLEHEEHGTIKLPAGRYIVRQQREYSPAVLRQVAD